MVNKSELNETLMTAISSQNPWFSDGRVQAIDPQKPKRTIYPLLWDRVVNRQLITAVIGLRRVGKTTLLKQIINQLLAQTRERKRIFYFSFEAFGYFQTAEALTNLIEWQLKQMPKGQLYFFLDEIQYVDGWNGILKKYFDLETRIKFVISGSSSLYISTQAKESLAGRIQEIAAYPLGLAEYLEINKEIKLPAVNFLETEPLMKYEEVLKENLPNYLAFGEFPYLPLLPGWEEKREYLLNFVIGKVLETDLPRLKKVRSGPIKNLAEVLLYNCGQPIQMENLGNDLGMVQTTLRGYLRLLEQTFLYNQVYNKGVGFRQREGRQRKIYPTSTNALALKMTGGVESESFQLRMGQMIESLVFNYLKRMVGDRIWFFRQRQVKEIDFLVERDSKILPIEVKYQNTIRPSDWNNLLYYCRKEKLREAVMVTKEMLGEKTIEGVKVRFIPAYFLV